MVTSAVVTMISADICGHWHRLSLNSISIIALRLENLDCLLKFGILLHDLFLFGSKHLKLLFSPSDFGLFLIENVVELLFELLFLFVLLFLSLLVESLLFFLIVLNLFIQDLDV